jgi:hypothetical protein
MGQVFSLNLSEFFEHRQIFVGGPRDGAIDHSFSKAEPGDEVPVHFNPFWIKSYDPSAEDGMITKSTVRVQTMKYRWDGGPPVWVKAQGNRKDIFTATDGYAFRYLHVETVAFEGTEEEWKKMILVPV